MKPTIVVDYTAESFLIHWLVLEKECPLEIQEQGITNPLDPLKAPYYLDGDVLIYDLPTLIQFLQERYPGEQLMPPDPVARAQVRQACTLIGAPDVDTFAEVEACLDTGSKYIAGDQFTLLDIYVGVWLSSNYTPDSSSVRLYWNRIINRPAYKEASK